MFRRLVLTVVILSTLLAYLNLSTFSYFSDTVTIENVTITAGTWEDEPEVDVLYSCPILLLTCGREKDNFKAVPGGWREVPDAKSLFGGQTPQCHRECDALLTNIWLRPEGNITLERVEIEWTGGGELGKFRVGGFVVRDIGQSSPASFEVGAELEDGEWYPLVFKFEDMKLRRKYSFNVTFIFSGNYTRTINFTLGG
ncbi:SipW-dependent-type signal peptide-containing protein [Palaeococcus ferrophilus]|uniref:SipW-dependent-type signal peptide-containing protein n=1 Tax=Palaeococcus ferrophilus TaxID=83868 RepID=UPI00064FDECC|nr:SipW-dependent-type signal peptide-containing protein [Palaeococcus ferrophilus]